MTPLEEFEADINTIFAQLSHDLDVAYARIKKLIEEGKEND